MMVCFLLLTQDVSAVGKPKKAPSCSDAKTESACKNQDSGDKTKICWWRVDWEKAECEKLPDIKFKNFKDYTARDLLEDVNQFFDKW